MDATSLLTCWDWPNEVDTYKYGRDGAQREMEISPVLIVSFWILQKNIVKSMGCTDVKRK
jgi:hypothetical protein